MVGSVLCGGLKCKCGVVNVRPLQRQLLVQLHFQVYEPKVMNDLQDVIRSGNERSQPQMPPTCRMRLKSLHVSFFRCDRVSEDDGL